MAGQNLTGESQAFSLRKNHGGLNSTSSDLALGRHESSDLQNIDFNRFGSFLKRGGYTQLNTSAFNGGATFVGLHWFQKSSGTSFLVGVAGNKIAKMDDLDGTWDDITGGLTVTAGDNNLVSSITFRDTYIATNNVNPVWKWTGTGNAALLTVPTGLTRAKFIETASGYTLLANVTVSGTDFRSRFHWSVNGEIETWVDTDFNDVNRDDGSEITGLKVLGEEVIIYKEFGIFKAIFTGDRDVPWVFSKTRSRVGATSGYSIQEMENGHMFRSKDGFYFFDGNNSFKLSDRIQVTLDGFNANRSQYTSSAYQQTKNRYWASSSDGSATQHDTVVTYSLTLDSDAFSVYKGMNPNVFVIVTTSGEERIYFGDYAGFVYRADTTSKNDNPEGTKTAIDAFYKTRWEDYGDILNQKGVPEVTIYHQSTSATLSMGYSYDFEDADQYTQTFSLSPGGALYGSAIYGTDVYGSSGGAVKRRDLTGRGRVVRLHFSNSNLDETFQIDGIGALPYLETNV